MAEPSHVEATPAQARDAERRQLTVLFCDLAGSTQLSSRLDPEDWREVVRGYQQRAGEVIGRFDGHVAQYLGDGILAYFGFPRAHEDDAERALRAGLGIVSRLDALNERLERQHGLRLRVRVGVHTGSVVVGEMGESARTETLAMGETTSLAARLQDQAEPDAVVMSAATLRLVQGIFVTRELGERPLKGIAEPVRVIEALRATGVRSRLDLAAAAGLTPLVGRDQELGLLDDRWAQVKEGWGQAVLISGEAGIGKSRLVQAFRERIAEQAHTWLECRCSPYTQDSALYPILELHRQGLAWRAEDPVEEKLARLEAGLEVAGFDLDEAVPLMAAFHGMRLPEHYPALTLSPEAQRRKTLELLAEWLLRLGQQQPSILLMEDLHWLDPSTLELVGQVLEQVPRANVLLLFTFRPDFEPPWGARSHVTPLLLSRLTRAQLGDLIRKAARERDLPDAWVAEIVRRADGVPLFAEELTRAVVESNPDLAQAGATPELHIPETLQDSLMGRLDALGPVKELAQLGAVLGREFSYELLLEVSPLKETQLREALAEAVREELFYQRGTPPEATYLFKHALIRDAAYQSLLRATRRRHHQGVAGALVDRMPEVAEAQPELVAYHLTEAGEGETAIAYWQRAGERAHARVAYEEAIRHLRRGLALLPRLGEETDRDQRELGLQMALGRALIAARGYAHTDTEQAWDRARALCDPVADPLQSAAIHYGLGTVRLTRGDTRTALEFARQLIRMGEHAGEPVRIAGQYLAGVALWYLGRFRECHDHLEGVISRYDPDRYLQLLADVGIGSGTSTPHPYAAWNHWILGFPDRAWVTAMEAVEHARRRRQPLELPSALAWAGVLATFQRDWAQAQSLGAEATRIAEEQGVPFFEAVATFAQVRGSEAEQGDPSAADTFASAMARAAGTGNQGGAPLILGNLAALQLTAGRLDGATNTVEGALAMARQTEQAFYDAELHRLKGEIFLELPDHNEDEAEALFREAIGIARGQEAKSLELRAATSLARLWQRQGKRSEARDLLGPIYDWFTEGFDTQDLKDAKALLEALG